MSIHWNHNHEDITEGERKGGENERERERERICVDFQILEKNVGVLINFIKSITRTGVI